MRRENVVNKLGRAYMARPWRKLANESRKPLQRGQAAFYRPRILTASGMRWTCEVQLQGTADWQRALDIAWAAILTSYPSACTEVIDHDAGFLKFGNVTSWEPVITVYRPQRVDRASL